MNKKTELDLFQQNQFTVSLDDNWQNWGFSSKGNATKYVKKNFVNGSDFCFSSGEAKTGRGGHNKKTLIMTDDCAKQIQLRARTEIQEEKRQTAAELVSDPKKLIGAITTEALAVELMQRYQNQIAELQPKADAYDRLMDSTGYLSMAQAAKMLGTGRNRLYEKLRELGLVISGKTEPYQEYIDAGFFAIKAKEHNGIKFAVTVVTSKGIDYLQRVIQN